MLQVACRSPASLSHSRDAEGAAGGGVSWSPLPGVWRAWCSLAHVTAAWAWLPPTTIESRMPALIRSSAKSKGLDATPAPVVLSLLAALFPAIAPAAAGT